MIFCLVLRQNEELPLELPGEELGVEVTLVDAGEELGKLKEGGGDETLDVTIWPLEAALPMTGEEAIAAKGGGSELSKDCAATGSTIAALSACDAALNEKTNNKNNQNDENSIWERERGWRTKTQMGGCAK